MYKSDETGLKLIDIIEDEYFLELQNGDLERQEWAHDFFIMGYTKALLDVLERMK